MPNSNTLRITLLLAITAVVATCRPPAATLKEEYGKPGNGANKTKGQNQTKPKVDHSLLDSVLKAHVKDGQVDYTKLHANRKNLDAYLKVLADADFDGLSRDGKLVLLINAYNACTLALILDHWPLKSINDIPAAERWKAKRWKIGKLTLSLDEIEHEYLRPKFKEPRIHFAVNCASIGCPPLRDEAYRVADIDAQLDLAARFMHEDKRWLDLDVAENSLKLTRLYDWFGGDFEQVAKSKLHFASRFYKPLAALLESGKSPAVEYIDYDWNLNGK